MHYSSLLPFILAGANPSLALPQNIVGSVINGVDSVVNGLTQHHYLPEQDWIPEIQQFVSEALHRYSGYVNYVPAKTSPFHRFQSTPPPSNATCSYWLEDIQHQGVAPYSGNSSYQVFRNVMDYGAKGDGVTDDTAAINSAISAGGRCVPGQCASTTTTPALVYFPAGTYMISSNIVDYYYTQLIGNPNCLPTIRAFGNFSGPGGYIGLIDGDPYTSSNLAYGSTNVFWRQIRNLIIDTTLIPANTKATGIHWPTGQATSITNVIFNLNSQSGSQHQGIFIESGSGGFMSDLIFNGGQYGLNVGNQQFTMRNMTFNGVGTAINQIWDWGWTYSGITINNCSVGLNLNSVNTGVNPNVLSVGSIVFFDSSISNTPIGITTGYGGGLGPQVANTLILENIALKNVSIAVQQANGKTALAGTKGTMTIKAWGEGHEYTPTGPKTFQGSITPNNRPSSLLGSNGDYYVQSKPQYEGNPVSDFISARTAGATGNGQTDDTAALQKAINQAASQSKILFIDAGYYKVTKTITIPAGSQIVGEAFSVIISAGKYFNSLQKPKAVVQIGKSGQSGSIEWSDMIVSTRGQQQGAILFQYNLKSSSSSPSGIWDVHARIGGFDGSNLQVSECPTTPGQTVTQSSVVKQCIAAFMTFWITSGSSGLYLENNWLWTADHDVDNADLTQITVYAGRGLLDESDGPVWLVGTAVEHHTLYQYQFVNAGDVFAGQVQTETPYYQPNPAGATPWPYNAKYSDPKFTTKTITANGYTIPNADAWGLRIVDSSNLLFYGAGFYSFFNNYSTNCSAQGNGEICQAQIVSLEGSNSGISIYNENTVGTHYQITSGGKYVAYYNDNLNGFIDTVALYRS